MAETRTLKLHLMGGPLAGQSFDHEGDFPERMCFPLMRTDCPSRENVRRHPEADIDGSVFRGMLQELRHGRWVLLSLFLSLIYERMERAGDEATYLYLGEQHQVEEAR